MSTGELVVTAVLVFWALIALVAFVSLVIGSQQ